MAHKPIIQIAITGARVFGRAFAEAWRQASAAQRYAQTPGGRAAGNSGLSSSSGITLDEAYKILNIAPPAPGQPANMEQTMERFKKLFDVNDPNKGGSFYLQSKILRARERIEAEVREKGERDEMKKEAEEGWKPKVYKDR